ncbi:MAG: HEAT repeat domain-containing protein [Scytonema sp. PMC 1069.18]|nr:HEAT repeat domain-containing protein [Scytonema sp. PMC 1069.18]MEC4884556.1 HEAT repeat domain-containing protein [Scytonema sp. PMC 1070.18]
MRILAETFFMRLRHSSTLLITCCACFGFVQNSTSAARPSQALEHLVLAQVNSLGTATQSILRPGSTGNEVQKLQTLLKDLGYYDGEVDGRYGTSTSRAVSKFQEAKGLIVDGVFGQTTRQSLQQAVQPKSPPATVVSSIPQTSTQEEQGKDVVWWSLLGIGVLGSTGAVLYAVKQFGKGTEVTKYKDSPKENYSLAPPPIGELSTVQDRNTHSTTVVGTADTTPSPSTQFIPVEKTSRLTKVNIVDQLIDDLHNPDPSQRRKAIWDLGQKGDSRAIQPLVDLMIDADSQQRSLILAALAEIGTRTLKPMNRALAISLQDESPQVRKNAIRDLTRVYDMMAQMSQMLSHAMHDSDAEVQATAKYALSQMNRIRALPSQDRDEDEDEDEDE